MSLSPLSDTICAPASSVGGGAVSIIRLSGPQCFPVLDSLLDFAHGDAASSPGYRLKRGVFFCSFSQLSLRPMERLNISLSSAES